MLCECIIQELMLQQDTAWIWHSGLLGGSLWTQRLHFFLFAFWTVKPEANTFTLPNVSIHTHRKGKLRRHNFHPLFSSTFSVTSRHWSPFIDMQKEAWPIQNCINQSPFLERSRWNVMCLQGPKLTNWQDNPASSSSPTRQSTLGNQLSLQSKKKISLKSRIKGL